MSSDRNGWILFEEELLVHRRHGKYVFRHFVDHVNHIRRSRFIFDGIFQRSSIWHAFRASCRDGASGGNVIQRDSRRWEYVLPAVFNSAHDVLRRSTFHENAESLKDKVSRYAHLYCVCFQTFCIFRSRLGESFCVDVCKCV